MMAFSLHPDALSPKIILAVSVIFTCSAPFHMGPGPRFGLTTKDRISDQCENFVSDLYPFCIFSERCQKFLLLPPFLTIDVKTG